MTSVGQILQRNRTKSPFYQSSHYTSTTSPHQSFLGRFQFDIHIIQVCVTMHRNCIQFSLSNPLKYIITVWENMQHLTWQLSQPKEKCVTAWEFYYQIFTFPLQVGHSQYLSYFYSWSHCQPCVKQVGPNQKTLKQQEMIIVNNSFIYCVYSVYERLTLKTYVYMDDIT